MDYGVELLESEVTFSLPDWVCDEKFDRRTVYYYGKGHAWEGSYDRDKRDNMLFETLFENLDASECCEHPFGPWIKVRIDGDSDIQSIKNIIINVLEMFKTPEYVKEVTKTRYFNKPY